ncbi:MAG: YggT family protein [Leucobacter sp.]|nr:YggT family protein [Leucobacter sp.]
MGALLGIIQIALYWVIQIYIWILWVRLILDFVLVFNRRFRPRGILLVITETVFTLTDPPIRFFRKILPPIRLGQVSLDLGWMLTLVCCWILMALVRMIPA